LILVAAASAVLLGLVLAGTWSGDRGKLWAGVAAVGPPDDGAGELGSEDGYVPVGGSLSPFSDEPALAGLDSALREALIEAATDAGREGITLRVNGGWRSTRYQRVLLDRAVRNYGSLEVARQYVKPPAQSSHVTGDAVDIGPTDADSWLSQSGSEYGLCQIYANEPWHFELATSPGGVCPAMTSDATGG
jgi:hypothetical protein